MNSRNWRTFVFIISLSPLFFSCESDLVEEQRFAQERRIESFLNNQGNPYIKQSGVYYMVNEPGYGYQIQPNDTVLFWYAAYTLRNIIFDTNVYTIAAEAKLDTINRTYNQPVEYIVGSGALIEGLNRGVKLSRGGEFATIAFSSDYGFGENNVGPIPAWTPLAYDVFIVSVENDFISAERQMLREYLASTTINYTPDTLTGILYSSPSGGGTPAMNDTIFAWYEGYTLDGTFIEKVEGANLKIALDPEDTKGLPLGLIHAFTHYSVGDTASVVIPSPVGFGVKGAEDVPPYIPLIYSVRLDSIMEIE